MVTEQETNKEKAYSKEAQIFYFLWHLLEDSRNNFFNWKCDFRETKKTNIFPLPALHHAKRLRPTEVNHWGFAWHSVENVQAGALKYWVVTLRTTGKKKKKKETDLQLRMCRIPTCLQRLLLEEPQWFSSFHPPCCWRMVLSRGKYCSLPRWIARGWQILLSFHSIWSKAAHTLLPCLPHFCPQAPITSCPSCFLSRRWPFRWCLSPPLGLPGQWLPWEL